MIAKTYKNKKPLKLKYFFGRIANRLKLKMRNKDEDLRKTMIKDISYSLHKVN